MFYKKYFSMVYVIFICHEMAGKCGWHFNYYSKDYPKQQYNNNESSVDILGISQKFSHVLYFIDVGVLPFSCILLISTLCEVLDKVSSVWPESHFTDFCMMKTV